MQTFLLSGCMGPCALFFRCQDATASITHLAKGIIIKLIVSHLEVSLNLRIVLRMWAFARSSEHPLNLHALDPLLALVLWRRFGCDAFIAQVPRLDQQFFFCILFARTALVDHHESGWNE